jgi:hypothetical protein
MSKYVQTKLSAETLLEEQQFFLNIILILIYSFTAIALTPGGSSRVHIYTQTVHRATQYIC